MSVFIQRNMRGLQVTREELSLLLSQYDPAAVCVQETLLRSNKTDSSTEYSYYGVPAVENNGFLHGGVGILVKSTKTLTNSCTTIPACRALHLVLVGMKL